jgi:type II secretory pathway component PulC
VTRSREKRLAAGLWILYAGLAAGGLSLLAHALFVPRAARPFALRMPSVEDLNALQPLPAAKDGLIERRFTRRVAGAAPSAVAAKPAAVSLDQMIKLTGILDFGGKKPTLAVIESTGESKAYKSGDKVGETGVVVKDIKDYVIVEFEKRRFKVTFAAIQELPASSVGKD